MLDIVDKYEQFVFLLEFSKDLNPIEAEKRAEKCFHVQALIAKDLHKAEYKEIVHADAVDVVKSELMLTVPSDFTNADSRKAWVHSRVQKKDAVSVSAQSKNDADYLRRLFKLYENASFYYAQKARR